jgi:mRNA interferase MazF
VYWVDFDPARGSEQAGRRPAVVISVDTWNKRMATVTIAAITSKVRESMISVYLPAGAGGLRDEGMILPFQVLSVDKGRLETWAGELDATLMAELDDKLRLCWGL